MSSSTSSSEAGGAEGPAEWARFALTFVAAATLLSAAFLGTAFLIDPYDTGRSPLALKAKGAMAAANELVFVNWGGDAGKAYDAAYGQAFQKETGITAIFVTHDQEEALSMSDRIVVMNAGSAEQVGTPEEVYETPATAFVADFLGKANMLAGTVGKPGAAAAITLAAGQAVNVASAARLAPGSKVTVVVRPQKLSTGAAASGNKLSGRVVSTSYLGGSAIYEIDIGGGVTIRANMPISGRVFREGEAIEVGFDPSDSILLDEGGRRIS